MIRFVAILVVAASLVIVSTMSADDHTAEVQYHCEMVQMWNEDANAGVPPEQRRGWPNYDSTECK